MAVSRKSSAYRKELQRERQIAQRRREEALEMQVAELQTQTRELSATVSMLRAQLESLTGSMTDAPRSADPASYYQPSYAQTKTAAPAEEASIEKTILGTMAKQTDEVAAMISDNQEAVIGALDTDSEKTREVVADVNAQHTDRILAEVSEREDRIQAYVKDQMDALKEDLNQTRKELFEQLDAASGKDASEDLGQMLAGMSESFDEKRKELKGELCEKIHTESVKNYRNVKALITEESEKVKTSDLSDGSLKAVRTSFKGLKALSLLAFLCSAAGVSMVGMWMYQTGFFATVFR